MVAYRSYLRELVTSKVNARDDAFASALLAIHDEDPETLTHEEIGSILLPDVRRARDDELLDR